MIIYAVLVYCQEDIIFPYMLTGNMEGMDTKIERSGKIILDILIREKILISGILI